MSGYNIADVIEKKFVDEVCMKCERLWNKTCTIEVDVEAGKIYCKHFKEQKK